MSGPVTSRTRNVGTRGVRSRRVRVHSFKNCDVRTRNTGTPSVRNRRVRVRSFRNRGIRTHRVGSRGVGVRGVNLRRTGIRRFTTLPRVDLGQVDASRSGSSDDSTRGDIDIGGFTRRADTTGRGQNDIGTDEVLVTRAFPRRIVTDRTIGRGDSA